MSLANVLHLYRIRLRARLVQEALALAGIAAGVALLFASQVSSSSLGGSLAELTRGIAGRATVELVARDPHGLPQTLTDRVRRLSGVRSVAPLLEVQANAIGPRGSVSVEMLGADPTLTRLGGALTRSTALTPFAGFGAIVLPAPLARTLGIVRFGQPVTFEIAGHAARAPFYTALHADQIGSLVADPIVLTPLSSLQEMSGLGTRVSRILIETNGSAPGLPAELRTLAGSRLQVEPIDHEQRLLAQANTANGQSTQLFAAVSALVGFLFAFNAVLFTVPQRRRLVADLRCDGYARRTVLAVLLLDGASLGIVASVLGLALGETLSTRLFPSNPAFLSLAFALGPQRSIGWQSVATALGGGLLAAIVAVLVPLRRALSRGPLLATEADRGAAVGRRSAHRRTGAMLAALICLVAATAVLLAAPTAAIVGTMLLVASLLLVLPIVLDVALRLTERLARALVSPVPHIARIELAASGNRAIAVAATGAIAVFGSVALLGAHDDLLGGLNRAAHDMNAFADVWVAPAGAYDLLQTTPFPARGVARLRHLRGVRSVRLYRGGLLDLGSRRVLVIAPPPQAQPLLPTDQIVEGSVRRASARVRSGGWLVISRTLATERDLRIGDRLTLPSPTPTSFRVAALSTNLSWAPGAIVMNAEDYARAWGSGQASAYDVLLAPGVPPKRVLGELARALGPHSGLIAETAEARTRRLLALDHRAVAQLARLALLVPLAAVLAMAAAIGAMIWRRRPRLARLKLDGFPRALLWRALLLESALLLGVGCLVGAVFGLYGQQLADRALSQAIDFPVVHSVIGLTALASVASIVAVGAAILAIPGYLASGVPAALAEQE